MSRSLKAVGVLTAGAVLLYVALGFLGLSCEECTASEAPWQAQAQVGIGRRVGGLVHLDRALGDWRPGVS